MMIKKKYDRITFADNFNIRGMYISDTIFTMKHRCNVDNVDDVYNIVCTFFAQIFRITFVHKLVTQLQ